MGMPYFGVSIFISGIFAVVLNRLFLLFVVTKMQQKRYHKNYDNINNINNKNYNNINKSGPILNRVQCIGQTNGILW